MPTGAAATRSPSRIYSQPADTSVFLPAHGTLRVAAIFADFADRPASVDIDTLYSWIVPEAIAYLETSSHGQLEVEVTPTDGWVRVDSDATSFDTTLLYDNELRPLVAQAVAAADPTFDFSATDLVWIISDPSAGHEGNRAWNRRHAGGLRVLTDEGPQIDHAAFLQSSQFFEQTNEFALGSATAAHETLHTLGLPDLVLYTPERDRSISWQFTGNFDLMSSSQSFRNGVAGGVGADYRRTNELFAYQRLMLGWLAESQVTCIEELPAQVSLQGIAVAGDHQLAIMKLSDTEVIAFEARLAEGYDSQNEREGVVVYTIRPFVAQGEGPIIVHGQFPGDFADESILVDVGQSLIVGDLTIVVESRTSRAFNVSILKQ